MAQIIKNHQTDIRHAVEFKSTTLSLPILIIFITDLKQIELEIEKKIAKASGFFTNSPLVLDLRYCNNPEQTLDIVALVAMLRAKKLIPIGISEGNNEQNIQGLKLNIPVHKLHQANIKNNNDKTSSVSENTKTKTDLASDKLKPHANMVNIIDYPIRSGQRIYVQGDLTVLAHVSSGAELMAEGNIHIYGSLRGKALAGVLGATECRIFCSDLQSELVSIAGYYKVNEEIEKNKLNKPAQIFLQKHTLIIKNL